MYIAVQMLRRMKRVQRLLDQLHPSAETRALCVPGTGTEVPHATVIVFTGSFNPPTVAHIALLKQTQRYAQAHAGMHLYAAFSKRTVDKEGVERPLILDRVMLLQDILHKRLAQTGILLFNRGLYVEQAQGIRSSFPRVKRVLFLVGFDKIVQIFDPHYYDDRDSALETLFAQAELLVAPRGNGGEKEVTALLQQPENQRFARYVHMQSFDSAYRDVSATRIRQGGSQYEHDTLREVRHFMHFTRAYAPPIKRPDGSEVDVYKERIAYLSQHLGPVS